MLNSWLNKVWSALLIHIVTRHCYTLRMREFWLTNSRAAITRGQCQPAGHSLWPVVEVNCCFCRIWSVDVFQKFFFQILWFKIKIADGNCTHEYYLKEHHINTCEDERSNTCSDYGHRSSGYFLFNRCSLFTENMMLCVKFGNYRRWPTSAGRQ